MVYLILLAALVGLAAAVPPLPQMNNTWWGPADKANDTSIRPFKIKFESDMVEDLLYRLKNHRPFNPPLRNSTFTYGTNSETIESWVNTWANEYNFTEREADLNVHPQYIVTVQGLDIHFIWYKQQPIEGKTIIPLLLMHGWPGSVREFHETLPLLTAVNDKYDFIFDVVAPSLPGFGFSDPAVIPNMGTVEVAEVLKNLMLILGYDKFIPQGGDWGSHSGANLVTLFSEHVLGFHSNMGVAITPVAIGRLIEGSVNPSAVMDPSLVSRLYPLTSALQWLVQITGYLHLQATKPDTLGAALSDSPSALAAWILQQVSTFTNPAYINRTDGGLDHYPRYKILDNLMIYWMTNSISTSIRIYAESFNKRARDIGVHEIPTDVPTYIVQAPHELVYMSPYMLSAKFTRLVNVKPLDVGGHFLALELPEVFAEVVFEGVNEILQYRQENCLD